MKIYSAASYYCGCGYSLMRKTIGSTLVLVCTNSACPQFSKRYQYPYIEVELYGRKHEAKKG